MRWLRQECDDDLTTRNTAALTDGAGGVVVSSQDPGAGARRLTGCKRPSGPGQPKLPAVEEGGVPLDPGQYKAVGAFVLRSLQVGRGRSQPPGGGEAPPLGSCEARLARRCPNVPLHSGAPWPPLPNG